MNHHVLLMSAMLIWLGASANAALIFYDSFDYDPGSLSTESGTWSDSGSTIEAGGLSYGSLATGGNRVTMNDDSSWIDTGTAFDNLVDDGDTIWFSVLVNTRSDVNPDFGFALGSERLDDRNSVPMVSGGSGIGFRVKNGVTATMWDGDGLSGLINPSSDLTPASYTAGTIRLIVGEIVFGATDTVNIYMPDTDLNLGAVVSSQTGTIVQTGFSSISFTDKAASPRDQVDEIRFGTMVSDVLVAVPEPSGACLGGLSALLLLRRRR